MPTLPIKHIGQGIIQVDIFQSGIATGCRDVFHIKNVVKVLTEPCNFTILLKNPDADITIPLFQNEVSNKEKLQAVMDEWVVIYKEALNG